MNEEQIIFGGLSAFSLLVSIGLLFLKHDPIEAKKVSKYLPGASLYQYKWFKYFGAIFCLIVSLIFFSMMFE